MSKSPAPAPRRRRSAEQARREILDAAQRRLTVGGPEAVRLQEVAADVGISHPTVLHHFGSREGLLEALAQRAVAGLAEDLLGKLRGVDLRTTLERVEQAFGNEGFARLLAWNVLCGRTGPDDVQDRLLEQLADGVAPAPPDGADPTGHREAVFRIRLTALALFGEALIGPVLSRSAGLEDDAAVHREFVTWLARFLEADAPRRS